MASNLATTSNSKKPEKSFASFLLTHWIPTAVSGLMPGCDCSMPPATASIIVGALPAARLTMRDHGPEQSFIGVAHRVLVDTNILVYRFDSRFPEQQEIATSLPRERLLDGTARIPHRAILEFVAATTRGGEKNRLLEPLDARREAEELMAQFPVIYPDQIVPRTAIPGAAAY